ncbi:putative bifunctional diguanylate cyclase/phosphodiesterase [Consotaella aegiceratis]|uniref:putative bifunctional diguanylate cyclase/phosphodiesterase n=1 Tax=Consotaella aegiceratis TaxID=3097961 RepID=UPI002F4297DE
MTASFVVGAVYWSATKVDEATNQRETRLVAHALGNLTGEISANQRAFATLDSTLRGSIRQGDGGRFEDRLAEWMNQHLKIDRSIFIDQDGRRTYAMSEGRHVDPRAFMPELTPVIDEFLAQKRAMADGSTRSIWLRRYVVVDRRPAMVYIADVTAGSGDPAQATHVVLSFLDGWFLHTLSRDLLLQTPHFSLSPETAPTEAHYPLDSGGGPIGYLVWTVKQPGLAVFREITPALAAAVMVMVLLSSTLIYWLYRISSRLMMSQEHVHHLAFHDPLTGLANRTNFAEQLDLHLDNARRSKNSFAVLFMDLDRFKHVNDTFGHQAGDELIRQVADRLRTICRPSDTVARLGGDEFAIVTETHEAADLEVLSRRIVERISAPFDLGGVQAFVGVSVGAVIAVPTTEGQEELIRRADLALYQSKNRGRSDFTIFSDTMVEAENNRRRMETDLRHALWSNDQLEVHYQPLLNAETGGLAGLEALLRWKHPTKGLVQPLEFLPVAEETGLILPLGDWVLRTACRTALEFPNLRIGVNLSAAQVKDPRLVDRVMSILGETGMPAHRLELEVPEKTLLENSETVHRSLQQLRKARIRIVVDDFGAGYTSIGYLRHLKVDGLKVDQSFIHELDGSSSRADTVVQAIASLARALELDVTAEGVETDEQMKRALAAGCQVMQGYLISEAVPLERLRRMLPTCDLRGIKSVMDLTQLSAIVAAYSEAR